MTELFGATAPVFKIGGDVKGELARDVVRLEIEEATDGLKTLMLRLLAVGPQQNADEEQLLYLDGKVLDFGKELEISIGPSDDARIVFKGLISAIEAAFSEGSEPRVIVFAEDKLMGLRMTRRMKTYENKSDAEIAQAIAEDHGIEAAVAADGPIYRVVQQWNQSDLAFLRERGRLIQAEVWLEDDKLCFKSRSNRTATTIALVQGNQLIDVQVRADLVHQRTKVKIGGFDANQRDRIDETAGPEAIQGEISGGRTGPVILQMAFGERVSYRLRQNPLAAAEAQAWAKAEMLRRCRGFVSVTGTTDGTPDMVVGSRVSLDRVGAPFNGDGYYVTQVRHTYDLEHGYRTHFEAERATLNEGAS
jgi:phage protein D